MNLWKSKKEGSIKIECREGKAFLNFTCSLGNPDDQHYQVNCPQPGKVKSKSATRRARDRARAATFQAAARPASTVSTPRTVSSPPPAGAELAISPVPSQHSTHSRETASLPSASSLSSPSEETDGERQVNTELVRWRAVRPCTQGPPHSCDDCFKTMTKEEFEIIRKWEKLSIEQAAAMI